MTDKSIKAAVRIRPFIKGEEQNIELKTVDNKLVHNDKEYMFDKVLGMDTTQDKVFTEVCQSIIDDAFNGYNGCVMTYGQTGSGKTYSLLKENGMVYQAGRYLLSEISNRKDEYTYDLSMSIYEIYNDSNRGGGTLKDLLSYSELSTEEINRLVKEIDSKGKDTYKYEDITELFNKLNRPQEDVANKTDILLSKNQMQRQKLRTDLYKLKERGVVIINKDELKWVPPDKWEIKGLRSYAIKNLDEMNKYVAEGIENRKTARTDFHEHSSRSHAVIEFRLTTYFKSKQVKQAKIKFVDLAGSERYKKSGTLKDNVLMQETQTVNTSLHFLRKIIEQMSKTNIKPMGEIRQCILTRVLSDSIGGNSHTWILANISPSTTQTEETLATLNYTSKARQIVNKVNANIVTMEDIDQEIEELKLVLETARDMDSREVEQLKNKLKVNQEFQSKLEEENGRLKNELRSIQAQFENENRLKTELQTQVANKEKELEKMKTDFKNELDFRLKELDDKLVGEVERNAEIEMIKLKQQETIAAKEKELQNRLDALSLKSSEIDTLNVRVTALQEQNIKKDDHIVSLNNDIKEKTEKLKNIEEDLAKKYNEYSNISAELVEKKAELDNVKQELEVKTEEAAHWQGIVKQKEEEVQVLHKKLKSLSQLAKNIFVKDNKI